MADSTVTIKTVLTLLLIVMVAAVAWTLIGELLISRPKAIIEVKKTTMSSNMSVWYKNDKLFSEWREGILYITLPNVVFSDNVTWIDLEVRYNND